MPVNISAYQSIQATLVDQHVTLIAVSKTKPKEDLMELYTLGHRAFGENYVQELVDKQAVLPANINWHFIGHLQSNKVKYIAPFISMIHAVDSLKLLQEINKQGEKHNRVIECLLQFHIADESTKFGLTLEEASQLLEEANLVEMRNIEIRGVMGMATFTNNEEQLRDEFRTLENYFHVIKSHFFKYNDAFKHLSMGMSGDYEVAIEEGATHVRVGSLIFGHRSRRVEGELG